MVPAVQVSFCATNLNTMSVLPASLDSVDRLGQLLGTSYEVVVTDGPSKDGARGFLEERARSDPRLRWLPQSERSRGRGRRLAFEASSGTTIVPFDTSLVYAPFYGEVLRRYLSLSDDRMLFSEICALRRRTIEATGGWRDLIGGEDVDLYARVSSRFGVIAYPTALPDSQSRSMSSFARQMRYAPGSKLAQFRRIYAVQRDQMIGANFRVRDLLGFHRRKTAGRRFVLGGFYTLVALGAAFRPIPRIVLERNNYLYFREALLRSMARAEWRALGLSGPKPQLLLTDDEIDYLSQAVPHWDEYAHRDPPLVGRKG